MSITLTPPCETDTDPVTPAAADLVFADVITDESCLSCGTTTEPRSDCKNCDAIYCGDGRCQGEHFDHCSDERAYAMAGGWDE